MKPLAVLWNF